MSSSPNYYTNHNNNNHNNSGKTSPCSSLKNSTCSIGSNSCGGSSPSIPIVGGSSTSSSFLIQQKNPLITSTTTTTTTTTTTKTSLTTPPASPHHLHPPHYNNYYQQSPPPPLLGQPPPIPLQQSKSQPQVSPASPSNSRSLPNIPQVNSPNHSTPSSSTKKRGSQLFNISPRSNSSTSISSSSSTLNSPSTSQPSTPKGNNNNSHNTCITNNNYSTSGNNSYKVTTTAYNIRNQYLKQASMSELSGGEKRFVFELEGKEPDFVLWVKKTNKKEVVQDRLFVLTSCRVYSIKRTKLGKKQVQRQGHLYDLVEIKTDDIDHVILKFTTFSIDITGTGTGITIPKILMNAFHKISFTFSLEASPSLIILPVERATPEIDTVEPGFAHGFVEVYKAQCNYYGTAENVDLIQFLEDTVINGSRVFCLDDFSGIDKQSENSLNMVPVMAALRHNTFFDTFICHNKSRKEIPPLLADVMHHNKTIIRIDLHGMEADDGWVQLGDAIRDNQSNELKYLDVGNNLLHDKGVISICNAIKSLTRPFSQLAISKVELQTKGASVAFRALQSNYNSSGYIERLDLSHNQLGLMGSDPLQDFLVLLNTANPQPAKALSNINFESTQLDTTRITNAIRQANLGYLQYLNLSENKFNNESVNNICQLLSKGEYLIDIKLRDCGLLGEQVSLIINACTSGATPNAPRSLDLSCNNLGKNGAAHFAPTIKQCSNIDTLRLGTNGFRKAGMTAIIQALEENTTLKCIDLSNNFKSGSKAEAVIDHLARVTSKHASIERLILAGKDSHSRDFYLGKEIQPLVKAINEESRLVELDISGNSMGDDLCRELFESLKKNTSLRILHIDNNCIGLAGFQAMKRCFTTNRTLVDIPVPTRDITKLLGSSKDKKATNDRIGEILNDVSTCLSNNKNGVAYQDVPSSVKTTITVSSSTPSFRATTYASNLAVANTTISDAYHPPPPPPSFSPTTSYSSQTSGSRISYTQQPPPPPLITPGNRISYSQQQQPPPPPPLVTPGSHNSYHPTQSHHDYNQQHDTTYNYDQNYDNGASGDYYNNGANGDYYNNGASENTYDDSQQQQENGYDENNNQSYDRYVTYNRPEYDNSGQSLDQSGYSETTGYDQSNQTYADESSYDQSNQTYE